MGIQVVLCFYLDSMGQKLWGKGLMAFDLEPFIKNF